MISISIDIGFNIVFNNTGIEWTKLQYEIKKYIESTSLHCISNKYYEELEDQMQCVVDNIKMNMYFKVNTKKLCIDVIVVKIKNLEENNDLALNEIINALVNLREKYDPMYDEAFSVLDEAIEVLGKMPVYEGVNRLN